jgi:virginiamycin A acetyltransferase
MQIINKILKKILRKTISEIIEENISFKKSKEFVDGICLNVNSDIGLKTKIYEPYRISDSIISDYTYVSGNAKISMTEIGKFCSIGPNLLCGWGVHPTNGITTSPMFYSTLKQNGFSISTNNKCIERKKIEIGNDVFIGANVTILDGIKIGNGAIIGAGAIVSKDIPPYAIAIGSPISVIKYRFTDLQIEALNKIKWWDFNDNDLKDVEKYFFDIDDFIAKHSND